MSIDPTYNYKNNYYKKFKYNKEGVYRDISS